MTLNETALHRAVLWLVAYLNEVCPDGWPCAWGFSREKIICPLWQDKVAGCEEALDVKQASLKEWLEYACPEGADIMNCMMRPEDCLYYWAIRSGRAMSDERARELIKELGLGAMIKAHGPHRSNE